MISGESSVANASDISYADPRRSSKRKAGVKDVNDGHSVERGDIQVVNMNSHTDPRRER